MNCEIPEVVCDVSYELVIKMGSTVLVMKLKVTLEIRQLWPPFSSNFYKKGEYVLLLNIKSVISCYLMK